MYSNKTDFWETFLSDNIRGWLPGLMHMGFSIQGMADTLFPTRRTHTPSPEP